MDSHALYDYLSASYYMASRAIGFGIVAALIVEVLSRAMKEEG